MDSENSRVKLAVIVGVTLWASAYVGIRIGLHGYTPGCLALFRYAVASLTIFLLYYTVPKKIKPAAKDILPLIITGLAGITLYNIFLNYGEMTVPAGIAGFIIGLVPVFVIIIAVIFLKEKVNRFTVVGVVISLMGLFCIAIGEMEHTKFDFGVVEILGSAILGSIYVTVQKPLLRKFNAIEVVAFAIWIGTFFLLPYLPKLIQQIPQAPLSATLAAVYLGIFPAAIAYAAWSYALKHLPATRVTTNLYFVPFLATLLGWLVIGEVPNRLSLLGGIIALCGAFVATRNKSMKKNNQDLH